jgi:hypothetical protein
VQPFALRVCLPFGLAATRVDAIQPARAPQHECRERDHRHDGLQHGTERAVEHAITFGSHFGPADDERQQEHRGKQAARHDRARALAREPFDQPRIRPHDDRCIGEEKQCDQRRQRYVDERRKRQQQAKADADQRDEEQRRTRRREQARRSELSLAGKAHQPGRCNEQQQYTSRVDPERSPRQTLGLRQHHQGCDRDCERREQQLAHASAGRKNEVESTGRDQRANRGRRLDDRPAGKERSERRDSGDPAEQRYGRDRRRERDAPAAAARQGRREPASPEVRRGNV